MRRRRALANTDDRTTAHAVGDELLLSSVEPLSPVALCTPHPQADITPFLAMFCLETAAWYSIVLS